MQASTLGQPEQGLLLVLKTGEGVSISDLCPCRFVTLLGAEGFGE